MTHKHRRKNGVTWACDCDEIESLAALLLEATTLLFDWDALVGGTGSHATETRDFLARVGYDPMTATLRKADSASACPRCGGSGIVPIGDGYSVNPCPICQPDRENERE